MKFAIGYQLPDEDEEPFASIVSDFKNCIDEVYFAWTMMPSGRAPLGILNGFVDWQAQEQLESDLRAIKEMGIKLNLLLNASCYGRYGYSRYLVNFVRSLIEHLQENIGLDAVTTMSPLIARTVKKQFPEIDVRASVNMRLGTVKALEYVADMFDSY
ncbi:MAG TPA: hypothetical protein EYP10_14220 [Armatimonadetes bacterium]|nr:hypothetical protein [Armatimonadota bacterium]